MKWGIGLLLGLILSVYLFLLSPFGQNWLTQKVVQILSEQWQTRIELKKARFSLFDRIHLEGLTVYDSGQDTLLHAGSLRLRISNWFFLRDRNELGPIRLDNVLVQIQRTDSVWQHEKLLRHFQGSGQTSGGGGGPSLNLRNLEGTRIRFVQRDAWTGTNIDASLESLSLVAERLDPSDSVFQIQQLLIKEPVVSIEQYNGNRPRTDPTPATDFFKIVPEWNGPVLQAGSIRIQEGRLHVWQRGENKTPGRMNPKHMEWTDLELSIENLRTDIDTLIVPFQLSGRESSGFTLEDVSGKIQGHTTGWWLKAFKAKTPLSSIEQDLAWIQSPSGSLLKAEIKDNRISPADLFLLTGQTLPVKDILAFRGRFTIRPDRIDANGLWAQWGKSIRFSGEAIGYQWRSAANWQWDVQRAELFTETGLLSKWIPISGPQLSYLKKLGFAQLRGKGHVSAKQAAWTGDLRTQLGLLTGKGKLQYPVGKPVSYQAELSGQLQGISSVFPETGIQSAQISLLVNGTGLLKAQANGQISALQTGFYRYEPIRFDLNILDPTWAISLNTRDPNLSGIIQVKGEPFAAKPIWTLDARLEKMDLTALGWNPDGLTLKGSLSGKVSGKGIEDLNGFLEGHSLELARNGTPLSLQEFEVTLTQNGQQRDLTLRSNEVDGYIRGRFAWEGLGDLAAQLGHRYFPSWIEAPARNRQTDSLDFSVRTYNIESYLELLHAPVRGLSNASVEGSFQAVSGQTRLKASLPKLQSGIYVFEGTELIAEGRMDSLRIDARSKKIKWNDSINIPEAIVEIRAHRDTAEIRMMAGLSQAVDKADIRSRLIAYADGLRVDLAPSTFLVQGKLWSIDENGQLIVRKGQPAVGEISMREGDQRIKVSTLPSADGTDNDIEISIESLNLHDFAPFFLPSNELEGLLTAKVRLVDPTGALRVEADTLYTRLLRFDADSIGEIGARLAFDPSTNRLTAFGETANPEEKLGFGLNLFLAGPIDSNRIRLEARSYPIRILERFIGNLFSDIRGKLTGEVELQGDLNTPALYGKGRLSGAGLRVDYTNCFYSIRDADIEITPTLIDLDGWELRDSATGNPIFLRGGIAHESFRNMYYDLSVSTRSPYNNTDRPVLLLNTDRNQNDVYFGTARGTVNLQLRGPQSDLFLTMQARASDRDSSYLTLLSEDGRESGEADFLVEREYGQEMTGDRSSGDADNFTVDIEINATPLVNAKVVLDELTGDVIRGRGSGTLKLRSGSNEPLSLRGRYNIEEGNYLFTFQSFFKKPFEIRKGGQHYVEWSGDPYDANIRLEAMYRADNVSFAPLVSSLNLGNNLNNARGDVFVNAELTDKLFQPKIRFSLGFPPNGVVDRNQELSLLVDQMQKNPNELNRQVTYLIVFNSFAPSELAGDPIGSGIGVSTISGVLLNVLSDQINKLLGNLLKSDKYTINLNTSLYNRDWMAAGNNALNLGSNINFSIGRSFFNNRFIISGGLGFDAPLGQSSANTNLTQSIQLLPDVTMEWLLNPSGSLRVGFFYRKNNDFLTNNTNPITARRTGGSLSYQKDYDHLGDLFRDLFRKKKKD